MLSEALFLSLIVFAAEATGYPVPPEPPAIVVNEDLPEGFAARYLPPAERIELPSSWQADGEGRSALLHELVHWLQDNAGALGQAPKCRMEEEAYAVEDRWREQEGLAPVRSIERLIETNCMLMGRRSGRRAGF